MEAIIEIFGLQIDVFSLFISAAVLVSTIIFRLNLQHIGYSRMFYLPLALVVYVCAAIGLPMAAILDFGGVEALLKGEFTRYGTSFYGGLSFAVFGLVVYCRYAKISLTDVFSSFASAIFFGYAIGRIGCLISGDGCYGVPTDLPWGMSFPNGIVPTTEAVHPTPLYESIAALIMFFLIHKMFRRADTANARLKVLAVSAIGFGFNRFWVEFVRINPEHWGLSQAQWISLAFMFVGALCWLRLAGLAKKQTEAAAILQQAAR